MMADKLSDGVPDCRAIRARIAAVSKAAKSAHFGSSLSCVEILHAIVAASNIRPSNAAAPDRDRLILSKGHAAMAYYAVMEAYKLIDAKHLERYLENDTALWGHITRSEAIPVIDASSGSLGHGLGLSVGYAQAYRLRRWSGRIYCVLSDGELDEGSTWEAALFAGAKRFDGLRVVIDYNKIQSLDHVANVMDLEPLHDKWRAFGWSTSDVDGHDGNAISAALRSPIDQSRPHSIVAHTVKGKGVTGIENTIASHYKPATDADVAALSRA